MGNPVIVRILRLLLLFAVALILVAQVVILPWVSGEVAHELPAEAHMRWPILGLAIAGLACVQVGIVCTYKLLGLVAKDEVFAVGAIRWVKGLTGAFLGGAVVCLATIVYQEFTVSGPPGWYLMLLMGMATGVGMALLMTVMRSLLMQAINQRTELDAVI